MKNLRQVIEDALVKCGVYDDDATWMSNSIARKIMENLNTIEELSAPKNKLLKNGSNEE